MHFGWDLACFLMESVEESGIIFNSNVPLYERGQLPSEMLLLKNDKREHPVLPAK